MQVTVIDLRTGRVKTMAKQYADVLVKLKRVSYEMPAEKPLTIGPAYNTRELRAAGPAAVKKAKVKKEKAKVKKETSTKKQKVESFISKVKENVMGPNTELFLPATNETEKEEKPKVKIAEE